MGMYAETDRREDENFAAEWGVACQRTLVPLSKRHLFDTHRPSSPEESAAKKLRKLTNGKEVSVAELEEEEEGKNGKGRWSSLSQILHRDLEIRCETAYFPPTEY